MYTEMAYRQRYSTVSQDYFANLYTHIYIYMVTHSLGELAYQANSHSSSEFTHPIVHSLIHLVNSHFVNY